MQKELLSAYIDGEHHSNELTDNLCQDKDLQKSWGNYHLIRSVMRQESKVLLGSDFTAKMEMLIEQEENVKIEQPLVSQPTLEEVETLPFVQKLRSLFSPMLQMAVAATVCLVAVFGVQSFNNEVVQENAADNPVLQTLPFNKSVQEVSYNAPKTEIITQEQLEQKNKRMGMMLQNYELQRRLHAEQNNGN